MKRNQALIQEARQCWTCKTTERVESNGYCRDCRRERARKYTANPTVRRRRSDQQWAATLRKEYGITPEDYWAMHEAQDGKCAICGRTDSGRANAKYFAVDHNHMTGVVRSLLCHKCNTAIGLIDENPALLGEIAAYLAEHE